MAYIAVLLITVINCVALFFFSLLAVGGDGGSDFMHQLWRYGYLWITLFALTSLVLCAKGERGAAVGTASITLPVGFIVILASLAVTSGG